ELCNIVARCLHKEPGDRFPQMADVVAALEPLIGINEARADFMFEGDNFEHAANAPRGRTLRLGTNTSLPYLLTGQDPSSRDRSSASTSSTDMDSVNSTATTDPVDSTATESPCSIEDEQLSQSHHSTSILTPRASLSPGPSSAPVATRRSRPPPPSVTSGVRTLPPPNRAPPDTPVMAESELEPSLSLVRCSPTPATLRQTPTATVTKRELRQAQRTTPRSSPPPKLLGHHKNRPRRQRHATQVVAMVAITLVITAVTAMLSSAAIDYLFPRSPALAPPTRSSRPASIRDRSPAATEPRPPATQRSEPPLDPTAQPQQAEPQQAEPQQAEPRQAEPQQAEPQQAELSPKPRVRKATRMPAKRTTSETQPPPPRPLWLVREPDKRTPATGPEENRDTIAPWED